MGEVTDMDVGFALAAAYLVVVAVAVLAGHGRNMVAAVTRREP